MESSPIPSPAGVVNVSSAQSVADTVAALQVAIEGAGAKVFSVIDQAAEAESAGLEMRPTTLIIFGNPKGGTPVMEAAPLAALDLPLKLLVWQAADGQTWISCLAGEWLIERWGGGGGVRRRPLGAREPGPAGDELAT